MIDKMTNDNWKITNNKLQIISNFEIQNYKRRNFEFGF